MRTLLALSVALLSVGVVATSAHADDPVAVIKFSGKGAAAVQKKVIKELEKRGLEVVVVDDLGDAPEAKAYVSGQIDKARKKWRLRIAIDDANSGRELASIQMLARTRGQLPKQVSRLLWKRSKKALAKARPKRAEPESEPEKKRPEREPVAAAEPEPTEEVLDETAAPSDESVTSSASGATSLTAAAARRSARAGRLSIGAAGKLYSRRLRYNDDVFTVLNEHVADVTVEVDVDASYYPIDWLGVAGSVGLTRPFDSDFEGTAFRTSGTAFNGGVRLRNPRFGTSVAFDYGGRSFTISDAEGMAKPAVPDVAYRYLRIGGAAEYPVFGSVRAGGQVGYRHVLSNGQITSAEYFPRATSGGADAAAWIGYRVAGAWRVRLAVDMERYFFAMNPEPGDMRVAGGAIDQYLGVSIGLAYAP